MMRWYLIHTKPRQERRALQNLERQGFACYLPLIAVEALRDGAVVCAEEPLFPRYLFIHLDDGGAGRAWAPIRSTRGVHRLVAFGADPAVVDDGLIEALRHHQASLCDRPRRMFSPGDRVEVMDGAFAGIEAVYQMEDGESRAIVLIQLMQKSTPLAVPVSNLRKMA